MDLFQGLLLYEIVLLLLGVLLFLVALYTLVTKHEILKIVPLLVISALMIGFPAIQKVKYGEWEVDISRLAEEVERNPSNPTIQQAFTKKLAQAGGRPITSSSTSLKIATAQVKIAEAQASTGDKENASAHLESALKLRPNFEPALDLRRRLNQR